MIGIEKIKAAIESIAAVSGVEFDSDMLADDAFVLAYAFSQDDNLGHSLAQDDGV